MQARHHRRHKTRSCVGYSPGFYAVLDLIVHFSSNSEIMHPQINKKAISFFFLEFYFYFILFYLFIYLFIYGFAVRKLKQDQNHRYLNQKCEAGWVA